MSNLNNVVELLQALVQIPSVNPEGNPGTDQIGEARCGEFVADFLKSLGAEVEIQEVSPGRPNVIGRFPSEGSGKKRLLLAPHLDTVSVVGMTVEPFTADIRDGKIWGRGTSDTKGPMAAMLWALREIKNEIPKLGHEIWFVGFMGEETGQEGSHAFVKKYSADFALVGEPTSCNIVNTHKGSTHIKIRTHGKAVHSSTPDLGENAIYKMMDILHFLRTEIATRLKAMSHPILGQPTISVGICNGGSKVNIVPDLCYAEVDIRTIPTEACANLIAGLPAELKALSPDTDTDFDFWHATPLSTDPSHPLIGALEKAGGKCVGAPWFCDSAVLAGAGIPSVAAGPGSIAQAHTKDEWISVEELENGVRFYKAFLQNC